MKKKLTIIICIILLILIIPLIVMIYPISKNNKYYKKIKDNIMNNTSIKDIIYTTKDNNYYIVKDNEYVYVLDLNYDIIYQKEISSIKESDLELTYTRNNLYYKEIIREKEKLIYNYYDVNNMEKSYTLSVGGTNE